MDRDWKPQHKEHQTYTPPPKAAKRTGMRTRDATGRKIASLPIEVADDDPRFDDSKPSRKQAEFEGTAPADDEPSAAGSSGFSFRSITPLHWKIIGGGILLLLLVFLVIIPGYRGYHVYKAMKDSGVPDKYLTDMTGLQSAKADLETSLASTKADLESCQDNSGEAAHRAETDIGNLNKAVDVCAQDAAAAREEADACQTAQDELDAVIQNAANRLCCIARVDNNAISAYDIDGQKIVCVSEGGIPISC